MSASTLPRLNPEEYLAIERAAPFKSEYHDGAMFAMSGGTRIHSLIVVNMSAEFRQRLRGGPYSTTTQDLRLRVSPNGLYTYPDIMVICGKAELTDDHRDTAVNPILLVEVLSPSTENHDRVFKFAQYRGIASLQEYVMVSQSTPHVETYRREGSGGWLFSEFSGLEVDCKFPSIHCQVPMREIYENVDFEAA